MEEEKKELPGVEDTGKSGSRPDHKKAGKGRRGKKDFKGKGYGKGLPNKGGNDFEFWNEYPELMGIATKFPWMHISGTPLAGFGVNTNLSNVAVQHYYSIPGVSKAATDPINLAFRQVYLDLHRKYRGVGQYEASDIAIAMICIESMFQLMVEAERIYGILNGYPIKSRVEPEGLLKAMGYTTTFIDSVKNNLADYRYGINRLIEIGKRLPLPAGMNFMRNHVALNGFVYRDSTDVRSGLIVFVFDNYYLWQGAGAPYAINSASTALSQRFIRSQFNTYVDLLSLINNVISGLLADTDIIRITSDFIACYGEDKMQILTPLPENYAVVATYSESILHKWHNSEHITMRNVGYIARDAADGTPTTKLTTSPDCFAVYQVDDVITSLPTISAATTAHWEILPSGHEYVISDQNDEYSSLLLSTNKGYVLDSWKEQPDEGFICESVLWKVQMTGLTVLNGNEYCIKIDNACTEILTELAVARVSNSLVASVVTYETFDGATNSSDFQEGLCQIDWAPLIYDLSAPGGITGIQGDVDNITVVSKDVIDKILDAAMLSAFKIRITSGGSDR